jgi:hypothetical protein
MVRIVGCGLADWAFTKTKRHETLLQIAGGSNQKEKNV